MITKIKKGARNFHRGVEKSRVSISNNYIISASALPVITNLLQLDRTKANATIQPTAP